MRRNRWAAVSLFFVAPLVAEFLLGNMTIRLLPVLIVLAPMNGGGALLIRETARHKGLGWRGIFVLGAAYTLVEEAFVTQSLFNPDYLQLHAHLLESAYIPVLGIGAWWTLFMLNLHTFWSISVSIALVEGVFPADRTTPWLGRIGFGITTALLLLGAGSIGSYTVKRDHFLASPQQFLLATIVCFILVLTAFLSRPRPSDGDSFPYPSPNPWLTGVCAFLLGVAVLITPSGWHWGAVAMIAALDLIFLAGIWIFAQSRAWTPLHTLSLGAGGALAYGLHAFIETPATGSSGMIERAGNVLFLSLAVLLIAWGAKRTARWMESQRGELVLPRLETA